MIRRASRPGIAVLLFQFVATVPALAQDPATATPSQLRELRAEVNRLGDQTVRMHARVVDMGQGGLNKRNAGLGAVAGGVLGAVLDGAKGAVVGAILGGGGAVVATSGKDVELPAGTLLTLRLERPLRAAQR
jgi:hypothetical protein